MTYTPANDKPEALLINYTTVRGAELKEIYKLLVRQGDIPISALEHRYARPDSQSGILHTDHVEDCVRFLAAIDVIEITPQSVATLINEDVYPELSFEACLLHHFKQQVDDQYNLAYPFEVLSNLNRRKVPRQVFLEEIRADDSREFGFKWNKTKLNMWSNLMDSIGAISYITETNEIVASPRRALLYELLNWYAENGDNPTKLLAAMDWIHDEIVPVYTSRAGAPEVAIGPAEVLRNMENQGVLDLRWMSDAQDVVGLPNYSGKVVNVAEFSVSEPPKAIDYEYPLDHEKAEVIA